MPATIGTETTREGLFASTRWTMVIDAGASQTPPAQALSALSELCRIYWRPIFLFLRRQGSNPHDAQDLTQGFFAHLIESRAYARADPEKGRFRSFLLGALKHFVAHARAHDQRQKRGGGMILAPLDTAAIAEADARAVSLQTWSAERVYEREWAETLLRRALDRLAEECALAGKDELFKQLNSHLSVSSEATGSYEEMALRLGRPVTTVRIGFDDAEEPDETLSAPVKDRLGIYRIERRDDGTHWELGHGAMAVTYRAVDNSLKRPVALKLIDSEWAKRGAEARERFMREARTAASLRHPNIATVYHFGIREENGQCFCVMELVEGETLEMLVRRTGPLDALTTIDIALQVSSALAAAEKQGLVHRDLKPANLMLVAAAPDANDSSPGKSEKAETVVKVIDFGVAKALVEKPDAMGLTHGGFVGTPAFASPEQFTDAPIDVRSDIYSLGVTLWYLLTGNRPFQGATIEQIRASQRSQALPIEQLKAARVPSKLVSLLLSMLALAPAARPGVRELKKQLQECSF